MACTGPTTEEGKAISARNALRDGATSRAAVLPWEDQAQYDALVADTIARHQPCGEQELVLANLVATTLWRYMRLLRVEAEFMSAADGDGARPDSAVAHLFADDEGAAKLKLILRYLANASQEYRTAVAELRRVQSERMGQDTPASLPASPAAASVPAPAHPTIPVLSRAERRALEQAQRKAEKRARQSAWASGRPPDDFVSYSGPKAA